MGYYYNPVTVTNKRIIIEDISPVLDCGRYLVKREVGDKVRVTASIFRDGHELIVAWLLYRIKGENSDWKKVKMNCVNSGLDLWQSEFIAEGPGFMEYAIEAYCDYYASWASDTNKKLEAGIDYYSDILEGAELANQYKSWVPEEIKEKIEIQLQRYEKASTNLEKAKILLDPVFISILSEYPDPQTRVQSYVYTLRVDRVEARFAAWYECFPRSCSFEKGKSGTFKDVIKRLPSIADMGFNVLYFPPIHPIGFTKRKGPNNSLIAGPNDPGCPYSIGNQFGGHYAIEPSLGTMEDFLELINEAKKYGIEIALDFAINCSQDHPYLKEHPDWFKKRPDGTIKFAENPPKKYEDIYPLNFDSPSRKEIWEEMKRIVLFWAEKGVRIFRVDNPHTKPFYFWEWLIYEVHSVYPDVIFLSEAFTRPKVMKALAKLGFTQSYSYFTWRNFKDEIIEYFKELTKPPVSDYMRANLFTNTPDIFPTFLQRGGRPAYKIRAVLAATLSSVYGIFQGFELCEGEPIPGKEEYLNSDKYEIRYRDWDAPGNIKYFIKLLNKARKEHPALQEYDNLEFYEAENSHILFYGKSLNNDHILVVVNLDPFRKHHSFIYVPINKYGIKPEETYQVEDLITGQKFLWKGEKNYIELDPQVEPAHVLHLKKWDSNETKFEYFYG